MLVKVDRASMACSLEVRNPYLDHDLVEWALALPPDLRLAGGEYKAVLKKSLEPFVPNDILYRPKQGFSLPLAKWLRGPLKPLMAVALENPILCEFFRRDCLDRLADEHASGRRDHAAPLWGLLMFERFLARERGDQPTGLTRTRLRLHERRSASGTEARAKRASLV